MKFFLPVNRLKLSAMRAIALAVFTLGGAMLTLKPPANAQVASNQPLTLRSDIQEANAKTGVITARGNVQINYPARQIQATAAQAQYFSRERRIVLSGNVYVLQQGNSLRGETITYLIDEGKFVALPQTPKQVEAIYLVPDTNPAPTPTTTTAPFSGQPEFPATGVPASPQPASPTAPTRSQPNLAPPISGTPSSGR